MKLLLALPLAFLALPLAAQAWDIRAEVPFANGQNLPETVLSGTQQAVSGTLNEGSGSIFTLSGRIFRVGPVLKLEWNAEYAEWNASGQVQQGGNSQGSSLSQKGVGFGVNAQFWVPFTGLAAEVGLIERANSYNYQTAGASQNQNFIQPWMRIGIRWELPMPIDVNPYICASYQQPLNSTSPTHETVIDSLPSYFSAQGTGQQFNRVWTFGVGIMF
jgi:hypothetical protein